MFFLGGGAKYNARVYVTPSWKMSLISLHLLLKTAAAFCKSIRFSKLFASTFQPRRKKADVVSQRKGIRSGTHSGNTSSKLLEELALSGILPLDSFRKPISRSVGQSAINKNKIKDTTVMFSDCRLRAVSILSLSASAFENRYVLSLASCHVCQSVSVRVNNTQQLLLSPLVPSQHLVFLPQVP